MGHCESFCVNISNAVTNHPTVAFAEIMCKNVVSKSIITSLEFQFSVQST